MKLRSRLVIPAVLVLTLVMALATPDGPPGVRRFAGWTLRPVLAGLSPLRLLRLGDGGGESEGEHWRRAYLQERARNAELQERMRAMPDLRGLAEEPAARRTDQGPEAGLRA